MLAISESEKQKADTASSQGSSIMSLSPIIMPMQLQKITKPTIGKYSVAYKASLLYHDFAT